MFAAHPLITEDTGTQGRRHWQLELTTELGRDHGAGVRTDSVDSSVVASYGLRDDLDVVLTVPHAYVRTEDAMPVSASGLGDLGLDMKWRFAEFDRVSTALKAGLVFPSGDEEQGLGAGRTGGSAYMVTSYDPAPWTLHLHLGYVRNNNQLGERRGLWHASIAATRRLGGRLLLVADMGADRSADPAADLNPAFLILGAVYSVSPQLDLDIGVKAGLTGTETDGTLLLGVALRP
jgi:hypothetical protein